MQVEERDEERKRDYNEERQESNEGRMRYMRHEHVLHSRKVIGYSE